MTGISIEKTLFTLILLGYLFAGALYAIYTPAWQAPDEPAHFNYVRQVAQDGCCPQIEPGDWNSDYLAQLTSTRFAAEHLDQLDAIQYEDHHPPLYYLLASLVFKLQRWRADRDSALLSRPGRGRRRVELLHRPPHPAFPAAGRPGRDGAGRLPAAASEHDGFRQQRRAGRSPRSAGFALADALSAFAAGSSLANWA